MRPSSPRMSIPARNHLFGVFFGEPSDLRHPALQGQDRHPAEETGCCRLCSLQAAASVRHRSLNKRGGSRVGSLMHIRPPVNRRLQAGQHQAGSINTLFEPYVEIRVQCFSKAACRAPIWPSI
jgi:hypothetical protein